MEYIEQKESVEIPKNVGVKGFLLALESILKLPRLQDINIDRFGKVHYRYFLREGESRMPLNVDFEGISPHSIVRNSKLFEVELREDEGASVSVARLFELAAMDHVFPVAFVAGSSTLFWSWYESSCQFRKMNRDELFGFPFLVEPRHIGENVLLLCAAHARGGALIDTQRTYKLTIPKGLK